MSIQRNSVELIGRLGSDPAVSLTTTQKKVAKFSIATTTYYKNSSDETVEKTTWHSITAWNKLAEVAEKHLTKGSEVLVRGSLNYNNYEDKEGQKRTFAFINANGFHFIDLKNKVENTTESAKTDVKSIEVKDIIDINEMENQDTLI